MKSFCNNCSKQGHQSHQCKMPIVSNGFIVYKKTPEAIKYLLICRKDSLGYVDFIRGKYSLYNKNYILNMMTQMTVQEKNKLRTLTFDAIWKDLWGHDIDLFSPENHRVTSIEKYTIKTLPALVAAGGTDDMGCVSTISKSRKHEDIYLKDRFYMLVDGITVKNNYYNLMTLLDESDNMIPTEGGTKTTWLEPEWGFPKGRKNYQEKDLHCALREFEEETGYSSKSIQLIENIMPFEEIFTGSNYKSYKHKYYLAKTKNDISTLPSFERGEVSRMGWFTIEECLLKIRDYNIEKRRIITNVHNILNKYNILE